MIQFTTLYNWQYNASSVVLSGIFTPSDEVIYILLLEDNAADYVLMHREQWKINRKEAKPKWTKVESTDKNSEAGIKEESADLILLWMQLKRIDN